MKNCGNKIKNTCAEKNYATCVYYELEVPTFSSLVEEDCKTLEETTEDQYNILGTILDNTDISGLGSNCITYGDEVSPRPTVKDVLYEFEQYICNLKSRIELLETTAICDINITNCGLTLPDNGCGGTFSTLGELLEYILNNLTPTP